MSTLSIIEYAFKADFPRLRITHPALANPASTDWLEIRDGDELITILWSARDGYCVTFVDATTIFDAAPTHVFLTMNETLRALIQHFAPPLDVDPTTNPASPLRIDGH